ncbi:hypothetical protein JHK82_050586 [Glycine max]|nr:hypothetical protein JHK85_051294 [Glycine max]KAG5091808.1 hypothetical protein JHK82_050586 [Glycine max]
MIWNCRGAGNATLYRYYKQCVDDNKPDMLVVLETRVDPRKLRHTFSILGYDGVDFVDGQGFAGRIIVAWRTHIWCRHKPHQFKFECAWILHPTFGEVVDSS